MSFDKPTRNLLAKMTAAARDRLAEDIAAQLQTSYGLYPDGSRLDVAQLPEDRHAAAELRALLDHFESAEPEGKQRKANAYERLVREIGFTLLNRLAALRLCEERGLVIECVRAGMNSAGFQLYDRLAGGALGNRYQTYRAFLACMFDELAADLGALFDRSTPQSAVFPSEPALNDVLTLLNDPELASLKIWQQDETIGWIYQYYNDPAERKKMRDESQAPRNSRELAVRNQFFTPRYVVEFLTDNTLGRTWYEMRQGATRLTEQCQYLVRRPKEIFLGSANISYGSVADWVSAVMRGDFSAMPEHPQIEDIGYFALLFDGYSVAEKFGYGDVHDFSRQWIGEKGSNSKLLPPDLLGLWLLLFSYQRGVIREGWYGDEDDPVVHHIREVYTALRKALQQPGDGQSQEEMLLQPEFIPLRAKKDPRRLRVLDPACGSGHFLLYAFDLLETIYVEAYDDPDLGSDLRDAFPDRVDFTRQVPRLILENNLHGIDIDPRAAQIAALALWLRAQRAWQAQKLGAAERPQIGRSHIVVAEPMPGDEGLLEEFIADLPKDQHPEIIGPLVRAVFEKMKLAGEAGSLLKIEEELKEAIEQARIAWSRVPQPEQLSFLPGQPKPKQLGLNLSGVTDESFWQQAEELVLHAMEDYSQQAENGKGIRRRLFSDDAAQGFAFIDICRKRYDVVLMNPPFGESSKRSKDYISNRYPYSKVDLFAGFIEIFVERLQLTGLLGAITSRTGLFLGTFQNWREDVFINKSHLRTFTDLGGNVLDTALVETAAYTLERKGTSNNVTCFRVLAEDEKSESLLSAILRIKTGQENPDVFLVNSLLFNKIPGKPFAYWAPNSVLRSFEVFLPFESEGRIVRQGGVTGNDTRYLRAWWEVNIPDFYQEDSRWVPYAKGGNYSPYYSDIPVVVRWDFVRGTFLGYTGLPHRPSEKPSSADHYFHPGLTWPLRAHRFAPVPLPENAVFSIRGYAILSDLNQLMPLLAIGNSTTFDFIFKLALGRFGYPEFIVGVLQKLPLPELSAKDSSRLSELALEAWEQQKEISSFDITSHNFIRPVLVTMSGNTLQERYSNWVIEEEKFVAYIHTIQDEIEKIVLNIYGISDSLNIGATTSSLETLGDEDSVNPSEDDKEETATIQPSSPLAFTTDLLDYIIGCVFGRWNILLTTQHSEGQKSKNPFAPLPACSPGMLLDVNGMPAEAKDITMTYPLSIPWDGILVDDPGLGDHPESNKWDIVCGLERGLQLIWLENHEFITSEACQTLGTRDLREYLRKPSGFFANHLKRYSKSRRQAPIYWPLSTPSGSYTLWIYYQRLNSETLYIAVNHFVSPKIEQVERYLGKLEDDLGKVFGRSAGELRDKVDSTRAFLVELNEFRAELLRVANLPYQPDLNDGVIINAAPLYKLFRLTKWSKDCQAVWEKLEGGEYDWAHMAYVLWPDRVREKCKSDKSLAIAHGLEELYQGEEKGKKKRKTPVATQPEFGDMEAE